MKFLIDAQLPPGLSKWLSEHGHESQHIKDLGLDDVEDSIIWDHALGFGLTIITKDEDFAERTAKTFDGPRDLMAEDRKLHKSGFDFMARTALV